MNSAELEKNFDQYLDALMEKKGLDKMSDEKKADFREKAKEMLADQFNGEVLRRLPDDKLEEFEKALDEDKSIDELGEIVENAGVDSKKVLEDVLNAFSDAIMNMDLNKMKEEA
ncbi:hypothetical protein IJG91_00400 [Candidatus Saccharibacteria bacterium]|nr:hypothetical protein [Candidatus Saccharibacteria bacterium]